LEPPHLPPLGGLLVFLPFLQATLWLLVEVGVGQMQLAVVVAVVVLEDTEQEQHL
jgi:hypothetical protein